MESPKYISINQVAETKGWTYHTARNRLRSTPSAHALGVNVGHAWIYPEEVLGMLGDTNTDNSAEASLHRALVKCWKGLRARVRSRPTYGGCSIAWRTREEFIEWARTRWLPETDLDKDLLVPGNRVYGPDTCCFIPRELNVLIGKHSRIKRKDHYNKRLREAYAGCSQQIIDAVETHWVFK